MNDNERFSAATKLLTERGIGPSKYAVKSMRIVSKLFFGGRPPHFRKFWQNALGFALIFAILQIPRWYLTWSPRKMPFEPFLRLSLAMAVTGGIMTAAVFEYLKSKYHLPKWEEIEG